MSRLVFVPVSHARAVELRAGQGSGPWSGFTVTPTVLDGLDEEAATTEEAEFVVLNNAGVAALTEDTAEVPRLVVVADVADERVEITDESTGSAMITTLEWSAVRALYHDEPDASVRVAAARAVTRSLPVAAALATAEVADLLDEHDLLWYAPEELDHLLPPPSPDLSESEHQMWR